MNAQISRGPVDLLLTRVVQKSIEAEGVCTVTLGDETGGELPPWGPGAHVDVHIPGGAIRQYSLCGAVSDRRHYRIGVLREPESRGGSRFMHDYLEVGDKLKISLPKNNFPLRDDESYLFIAGGIGITPILSMVHDVAARGKPWTLHYGGRSRASMAFLDELKSYGSQAVHIVPQDESGLLPLADILGGSLAKTAVYCCGPDGLLSAVEQICLVRKPLSLHKERFVASAPTCPANGAGFDVLLAQSNRTLTVAADENLLEVLEGAGCTVPNSCRAGICGTCLVAVLSGAVDHRDELLTDEQRASNRMILPCVSRSTGGLIVLDI